MRILYVEDNPANVFLVKRVAKMGNHEVISFVDGTEALARFHSVNPDLVLMDIQISGELNGLEVVQRLRADGVKTPIVAVTAYAMVGDRERCLEAGCDDYMAKPLPIPHLVQLFQQYAQNTPARLSTSERLAVSVLQEKPDMSDTQPLPAIREEDAPASSPADL
ncbi:response regulator [Aggregatilineales bacterium SYSU G02658]